MKRSEQIYLQTWHGTPLKKLGLDIDELHMSAEASAEAYRESIVRNAATWDLLIAQNAFSGKIFRRCFGYSGTILESGYPRNDLLVHFTEKPERYKDRIDGVRSRLSIPDGKRIMLYAPTWRDDTPSSGGWYSFTSELDLEKMADAYDDDYCLLLRFHYLVRANDFLDKQSSAVRSFVRVCESEYDISELYLISDILITDYSSVMFDYSILKRPMFFFAYDLENYRDELRGFYFDFLSEVPGPVVRTTIELIEAIDTQTGSRQSKHSVSKNAKTSGEDSRQSDICRNEKEPDACSEHYYEMYNEFCARYNSLEDGLASKRAVTAVCDMIESKRIR